MSTFCAYRALNLSKTATSSQIKQNWFKIAMQTHPDRGFQGDKSIFLNASRAYELLKSPEKRRLYDLGTTATTSSSYAHSSKGGHNNSQYRRNYRQTPPNHGKPAAGTSFSNGFICFTIMMGGLLGNLAYVSYIRHKWEESRHLMDKNDLLLQAEWERAKSTAKTRRMRLEQRAEQEVKEYLTPCKQLEFASKVLIKSKHLQDKKVSSTGDHHVTTTNLNNNHSGLVAHCI